MSERKFADGKAHFKAFYGKLNVISEIIRQKNNTTIISENIAQTFNKVFGNYRTDKVNQETMETQTLQAILDKQHESDSLIGTFEYQKPNKSDKPDTTNSIAKNLRVGGYGVNNLFSVTINNDAQVATGDNPDWFDQNLVSIFFIEEKKEGTSNIKELHSKAHQDTTSIKSLFTFKETTGARIREDYYVWESKYNMLAHFNQPFLLLTFDMYYYNVNNKPLFKNNFDIKNETAVLAHRPRPRERRDLPTGLDGNLGEIGRHPQWGGAISVKQRLRLTQAGITGRELASIQSVTISDTDLESLLELSHKEAYDGLVSLRDEQRRVEGSERGLRRGERGPRREEGSERGPRRREELLLLDEDDGEGEGDEDEGQRLRRGPSRREELLPYEGEGEGEGDEDEVELPLTVESLLYIETFSGKLPTFLMLLIYYAGYSFNIDVEHITSKFRNKFNQSENKTSFPIKLYAPISDKIETMYNNVLKSQIQPTSVDLAVETLEVYHVGSGVISLWDYVNGKLTILINNMLNSKERGDKDRYKTLFKKQYSSNSLFLFECIDALKKYKEYILNPANITTIAFPMSTLKTLEILILKLSYILSLLEPTFIPIETMSFDVIMNGKTLKYVINSELQATNISIDDYISNDKLMSAILSTRAAVMTPANTDKANTFLTDSNALDMQKSVIKKMVDDYHRNYLEKNIAYERIETDFTNSHKKLEALFELTRDALNTDILTNDIPFMESLVKHNELGLHHANAIRDNNMALYKMTKANKLFDALNAKPTDSVTITTLQTDLNKNHPQHDADTENIQQVVGELRENRGLLLKARKQTPEQIAKQKSEARERKRIASRNKPSASGVASGVESGVESGVASGKATSQHPNWLSIPVAVTDDMKKPDYTFGLSFGIPNIVIDPNFELGKIISMDKLKQDYFTGFRSALSRSKPKSTKRPEWPFGNSLDDINKIYVLKKIQHYTGRNIWSTDDDISQSLKQTLENEEIFNGSKKVTLNAFLHANSKYTDKQKEDVYKLRYLIHTLTNLTSNERHTFFFEKQDRPPSTPSDQSDFGGGKNTTKKVNRKQRQGQTHSKTKKVFES